jgi:hypothetical protein
MAEVFSEFFTTKQIDIDLYGFDAGVHGFVFQIIRRVEMSSGIKVPGCAGCVWAGIHRGDSVEAGVHLGRMVARYDLHHAFGEKR